VAPPRGRKNRTGAPKPALPDERPRLPGPVYRDLRAASRPDEVEDVTKAYGAAGAALAAGDAQGALTYLRWAKGVASRSAVLREALGVALYEAGEYEAAHAELLAYRRMSGRADQNHLLADCARALGRVDKVGAYVEEMRATPQVPGERLVEGLIVLAGHRADAGDVAGALAALDGADLEPERVQPWHPRVWFLAATLAERLGDAAMQREYLEAVVAVEEDYLDARERLEGLGA
jgi:tetratricopeptide (TPR) repeat protein